MIELDVYYFYWLSTTLHGIDAGVSSGAPLRLIIPNLVMAQVALEGFRGDVAKAFPRTAASAAELLSVVTGILPSPDAPMPNVNAPIAKHEADRLRVLGQGISAVFRHEAPQAYVVQVQDQRCFSSHTLVEKIENCLPPEAWEVIEKDARREFEEAGKCMAFERYTSSGFHALRAVECVIRQYIEKLTGAPLHKDRKRDWGFYIKTLADNGADPKLIAVLDNIRTLDRNPLMHPEDWLDIDEAVGIFTISQTAIVRLVAGIKK